MYDVDLFVIGAGSGGVRAARTAAGLGAKVAIAEDQYMGGTCVNVGCVPKKLYSYASHFSSDFENSRGFGWNPGKPSFNWELLKSNKVNEIKRLNGIYESLLNNSKVSIHNGRASIVDAHTVDVAGTLVTAQYILIATGGWPFVPPFPGNELVQSSNEIFDLETFPKALLVIGGGYIAVEFAGIFAGLGSSVTLSYRGEKVLKGFDEDVRSHFMTEAARHVDMYMNSNVASIEKTDNNQLKVSFDNGEVRYFDAVLSATGRKPNTLGLGLENVATKTAKNGSVVVNSGFQTDEPSIYAIGDVVGHMALTPVALAEGMFIADHLFGTKTRTMSYDNIATAVFSHPNIATVGMSEQKALELGYQPDVYESDFRHLKHTLSGSAERTYMKIIVDSKTDKVLGMHMLGQDAGEIIQGFAAALICGVTKTQLDATIGIHPTAAEEFVTMRQKK